jgi:RimJ/RimL family protein N-acetyltransferase
LRPPIEADASAISAIAGDWEVARRLARMPHPYTPEDFRFFMTHIVPRESTWAIIALQSHEIVGVVGLAPDAEGNSAELGYYVGRSHWGHGFATEAAQAIVRMTFEAKIYAKLTSRYYADNPASGRVLVKLGFRVVGHSQVLCRAEGTDKPTIDMELVA